MQLGDVRANLTVRYCRERLISDHLTAFYALLWIRKCRGKPTAVKLHTGARAAVEGLRLQGEREAGTRGRQIHLIVVLRVCKVKRNARSSRSLSVRRSTTGRGDPYSKYPMFEDHVPPLRSVKSLLSVINP